MHRVTNAATKWRIGGGGFTKEALSVYDVKIPGGEQAGASVASELLETLAATQVRLGESLAHYTHLGIGGQADILVLPSTARHVQWTVECANRYKVPFLVMGNGSNLLVRDGGVRGIVMALIRLVRIRRCGNFVFAEGGVPLTKVSTFAQQNGLGGLEFACGIPGTVGGAVAMNAGAYGGQMSDILDHVVVLTRTGQFQTLTSEQLHLTYRNSVVEQRGLVVLESAFRLTPRHRDLVQAAMDDFTARRVANQPLEYPSCGSVFKRPPDNYASRLIQSCGLQGFRVGGAEASTKHAGFIVNVDHASASDYMQVIHHIREVVSRAYGVVLELEVKVIGEDA